MKIHEIFSDKSVKFQEPVNSISLIQEVLYKVLSTSLVHDYLNIS